MSITSRSRLLTSALLVLTATAAAPATAAPIAYQRAPRTGYWSPDRMTHAVPMRSPRAQTAEAQVSDTQVSQAQASVPGWAGGGPVAQNTGKVFFTLDGSDYVCSAAALTGGVVVTAAHCVTDGYGTWATNWTFVPGYADGNEPYGSFTAQKFFVSPKWNAGMNEADDVAFTRVTGLSHGLPVSFGQRPSSVYVFGYPTESPYDGSSIEYCSGPVSPDPSGTSGDEGVRCAMTAGDSGGPWLAGFDPVTGTGTVMGVNAFKYSNNDTILYGALFGSVARSLYDQARASG
jgi:V8-like Glu-specific endopeptidase